MTWLAIPFSLGWAQPITYTLDPAQSVVGVSGQLAGFTIQEQGPGSLSTRYEGTLGATGTACEVTFDDSGLVTALNSGSWAPRDSDVTADAPANYGILAEGPLPPGFDLTDLPLPSGVPPGSITIERVRVRSAIRNLAFTLGSPTLAIPSDGALPGTRLVNTTVTGNVDVAVFVDARFGFFTLPDQAVTNFTFAITNVVTTNGNPNTTLARADGVETLTVELDNTLQFTALATNDVNFSLQGQIVASRPVAADPAPGIAALPDLQVMPGMSLTNAIAISDPLAACRMLTFTLQGPGSVTPGAWSWTPTAADIGTQMVTISATDILDPTRFAFESFQVVVAEPAPPEPEPPPPPEILAFVVEPTQRAITFEALGGFSYELEVSPGLESNTTWVVADSITMTGTNASVTLRHEALCVGEEFYRLQISP